MEHPVRFIPPSTPPWVGFTAVGEVQSGSWFINSSSVNTYVQLEVHTRFISGLHFKFDKLSALYYYPQVWQSFSVLSYVCTFIFLHRSSKRWMDGMAQGFTMAVNPEQVSLKDEEDTRIASLPAELLTLIFIFAQPIGGRHHRHCLRAPFEVIPMHVSCC